ncbi:hypothetical protein LOD99_6790 [Oopsacas minuta]|uniref:PH domain-containing protein n=1 Tax=Oopsacas minuta TaxID=111878 RepID=A0AAV7JKN5_9METZ|nr:hypothetical protein LOD99_6790 [Oopsacas minuta]
MFKKKDPKEQVKEWKQALRKESNGMDRQIRGIQREELKVTKQIKDAAKKGNMDAAKILAKEMVQSRRVINKIYASKAQLNSVSMQMDHQLAMIRMAGSMEKSTEVMKAMEKVIKLPEIRKTMMDLAKEMHKAGVIDEMLTDTLSTLDDEDLEDVANSEVEKILNQVLESHGPLPIAPEPAPEPEADEDDVETMAARLNALRS